MQKANKSIQRKLRCIKDDSPPGTPQTNHRAEVAKDLEESRAFALEKLSLAGELLTGTQEKGTGTEAVLAQLRSLYQSLTGKPDYLKAHQSLQRFNNAVSGNILPLLFGPDAEAWIEALLYVRQASEALKTCWNNYLEIEALDISAEFGEIA